VAKLAYVAPVRVARVRCPRQAFTYVFIAELALKHAALGVLRYWTNPWNVSRRP
jgi:hypothetical protein